jgi:hypothetical protein
MGLVGCLFSSQAQLHGVRCSLFEQLSVRVLSKKQQRAQHLESFISCLNTGNKANPRVRYLLRLTCYFWLWIYLFPRQVTTPLVSAVSRKNQTRSKGARCVTS